MTDHGRPHYTLAELVRSAGLLLRDPREAQILVAHALGCSRETIYAHPDHEIAFEAARATLHLVERRRRGEPVAYLLGEREFYGLPFGVNSAVLIPRPESELLVELVLDCIAEIREPVITELGTGSGAVSIAIARARPDARIFATDCFAPALAVAAANILRHSVESLSLVQADWLSPFSPHAFDLIVSNPPYVTNSDSALTAGELRAEPRVALCGGADGLVEVRKIIADAPRHLRGGGWLVLEHGADQQPGVIELTQRAGFARVTGHADLAGLPRAISASLPSGGANCLPAK